MIRGETAKKQYLTGEGCSQAMGWAGHLPFHLQLFRVQAPGGGHHYGGDALAPARDLGEAGQVIDQIMFRWVGEYRFCPQFLYIRPGRGGKGHTEETFIAPAGDLGQAGRWSLNICCGVAISLQPEAFYFQHGVAREREGGG